MKNTTSIPKRVAIRYLQLILPVLLIVFVGLASAIFYLDSHNQMRINRDVSHKILDQANKTLQTWLDDQLVVLAMLAEDARVIEACAQPADVAAVARANDFLHSFHEKNGFYENIALSANLRPDFSFELTAVNGRQHVIKRGVFFADSTRGDSIGKSNVEHPMAKSIYDEGKPNVITHVYRSLIYGNPAFIISLPVRKDGVFVGAIHVAMPMRHFTDKFVNGVKMGQTGYMFMVDEKGLPISHPEKSFILSEEITKKYELVRSRIVNGEEHFELFVDDVDKTYHVMKFDFHGLNHVSDWYLILVQDTDEILASSFRFVWLTSVFLVMAFLLVIAVVYVSTVKLLQIGFRDALTGLYNRNYLEHELLRLATGRFNPIGFISIDVDGLKLVNDTCGHDAGDVLLAAVGREIKECFNRNDLVIRLGGDEFAVVMHMAEEVAVQEACQRVRDRIAAHNREHGAVPVSVSIGWSIGQATDVTSTNAIIKEADTLMYKEKEENRLKYAELFAKRLSQYGQKLFQVNK
ncbi:sensor domain-containing diguanylate cyclase [Anaeromusa acidaminophila]|uniref:sensor domain-containing diguanylate cyclase n=1 Tax=Anaeromusa acidaminophila TaxID=81464 RepID=UPI000373D872|nr:sensor domain-containing diguanylate cyclase [Anaeromusa acidaminophila]